MKPGIRTGLAASVCMLILIIDTKTALLGANEGIRLCVTTIIPSILPFIFLSNLLTSALSGTEIKLLRPFGRCMRMPQGSESLFIIGLLGGYPTGAQAVSNAYSSGQLSREDARRLLGFCSNAGPSFLFGIIASHFPTQTSTWLIWLIHLASAFITGTLLPGGSKDSIVIQRKKPLTAVESLRKSIYVMAQICGWVILFRVLISFVSRWFFWYFDSGANVLINGFIELSIGCISLSEIASHGARFVAAATLLGFGGLCVLMQTASTVGSLGLGMYLPGKVIQCCVSIVLASVIQYFVYTPEQRLSMRFIIYAIAGSSIAFIMILAEKRKKRSRNPRTLVV